MAATQRDVVAITSGADAPGRVGEAGRVDRPGPLRAIPGGGADDGPDDQSRRLETLATNIARCALEAIAGVRDLDQLARWVTPAVYRALLARVQHAARARHARRRDATRPNVLVRAVRGQHDDCRSEITIVVEFGPRVRAVCLVIELVEARWRATSVAVL